MGEKMVMEGDLTWGGKQIYNMQVIYYRLVHLKCI